MTQRPVLLLALTLAGCGAAGGSDDGGTSGNGGGSGSSGTTFCAILRSERERCASSSGGSDRTTSTVERCDENVARCTAAPSAFNTTRDPCVTTTTFQLSRYNDGLKPHPGTCSEYRQYQAGTIDCLSGETLSDGQSCRAGRVYCGETAFPSSRPSAWVCDGARVALKTQRCVAGVVTDNLEAVQDCAAEGRDCRTGSNGATCVNRGAGGGSSSGGTGGGSSSGGTGGGSSSGGGGGPPPPPPGPP